ncbi:MAG: hypothetical protein WA964_06520 [Ilumatobacter sp.]|uniref:hypothetical protein n=1 Tax=Ilumatobacter sp. TaxID=1967498 RepID=UPI003C739881
MGDYTKMKGAGKSRHLPIGTPGSCLTEADRSTVVDATDMSGPECRRCQVPVPPPCVISIQFTISSRQPATVLDIARTQAAAAFECTTDDPALVVTVGTGIPEQNDTQGLYSSEWVFVVNASWDTETGTAERSVATERRSLHERRSRPERRG